MVPLLTTPLVTVLLVMVPLLMALRATMETMAAR